MAETTTTAETVAKASKQCLSKSCHNMSQPNMSYCKDCSWVDDDEEDTNYMHDTDMFVTQPKQAAPATNVAVPPLQKVVALRPQIKSHSKAKCETCDQSCTDRFCSDCRASKKEQREQKEPFQKCQTCGITCRARQCLRCVAKSNNTSPNLCKTCNTPCEKAYCQNCINEYLKAKPQYKCESCSLNIREGRFCFGCKDKYRNSFTKKCGDCQENFVAKDKSYCPDCVRKFKQPRPCITCGKESTIGRYCGACVEAYKRNRD